MIAAADFWPTFMRNEAGAALCRYYAIRGGAALGGLAGGGLGGIYGGAPASLGGRRVGSWIGGGAGAALGALICPDEPPNIGNFPLAPDPGFSGGCADGVVYTGTFEYERNDGLVQVGGLGLCWGAITGIQIDPPSGGGTVGIICRGDAGSPIQPPGTFVTRISAPGEVYIRAEILTLARVDGQPDVCPPATGIPNFPNPGDLPDLRDDPAANTPISVDVDFGGTTINVNGNLRIVAPVFAPRFGVDFNFDGLGFRFFPNGEINVGGGQPQPDPGTDPNDDEPPTEKELKGIFYNVTNIAENQRAELISGGQFFYPRFGAVRFTGRGRFSESVPMAVTSGYVANPNPSWFDSFVYTPYNVGNTAQFSLFWQECGCEGAPTIQVR